MPRIGKWGGSLTVRLPKNIVDLLGIREKDHLIIRLCDDNTIQIKTVKPVALDGTRTIAAVKTEPEETPEW